jgi:Ni/Fe-hydrogenase 1 B-type cytochrome subunit
MAMKLPTTREEHPPLAIIAHWLHAISMAVLITTGLYIYKPYYAGAMGINKLLHICFAFVVLLGALTRVYWAFFGSGSAALGSRRLIADYRFFGLEKGVRHKTIETIKYYLFLRSTHPTVLKYNPLQKAMYLFWLSLVGLMAVSGFSMWAPTQPFFLPLTYLVGGLAAMHEIHQFMMWVFLLTISIHIYLVFVETFQEIPLMFWWHETKGRRTAEQEES